jgi:hypothetical protein
MAEPKQLKAIKGGLNIAKRLLADSDEGRLNTIREAGRAAHEQEAAIRAARNAEVKKQLANLPARNKKANEALGLYHPVGGGIKLSRPTSGMNATTVADPMFNPPEIGNITPEQLVKEGAALFPLVGDRAAAGRYLTHVGENELEAPVRLTGGPRYMDANYNPLNPEESAAWESGAGRVTALGRQAERAGQGGRPVYGIYTAGSGTNTDFNIMGANALFQQIPYSKITKKAEKEFDLAMRNGTKDFPPIPNWPGIRSPEAKEMLLDKSNGIVRTKLFGTMGKENFQSMGFPDVPATRKAIIEPELLDVPTNQAGFRLARMDTTGRIIENPNIPSDYPAAMAGQVAGKLDVPTDYKDIFQSHFDARRLLSQPESGDYYSFSRAHPIQYADDEWLNRLMEQRLLNERKIKEGEYKKGGEVNIDAADARLSKAISERMSGGGMAKGGSVDIKSADARLQAAIDARMGMADGGEAGFKKIQFMADGGKLVKGGAKVMKKLLADEAPAVNRDANLQKFLSKSQVKDPVFHASKADVKQFSPKHRTGVSSMGHHFGTAEQANFRTTQYDFDSQSPNIGKYHLNVENPLEVSHMASFAPDHLAEQLMDMNLLKPEVYDALSAKHNYDNVAIGDELIKVLRKNGYDGLKYANEREGEGFSYVPLNATQIKSATGNRGTYDIEDADITKAEGGGAFKKLEFMADGGKLVKGAAQIGKRLMADNSLPALEREANLKKFLEPSKTPMRLYHGTTATEGGKRNEAIRRIKPSKEGALGSGVYMTPKPNYASNYALDHMTPESYASSMGDAFEAGNVLPVHAQIRNPLILGDTGERIDPAAEALMKLGMDKEKAQMMVERLYEDKGNIGKQIQTRAQAQGYDGLMLYHTDGELGEVVSYQPSAVKSAIGNEGTYDIRQPDLSKAEGGGAFKKLQFMADGGGAFKTLQFKDAQHFDGGGIAIPEMNNSFEGLRREPLLTEKDWANIKRNAPEVYDWAKQNIKDEASQLKTARGVKDFALRTGAQYLGGIPDLINLGLMGVDAVADTSLSSEKPWFGSEQYIQALKKSGAVGENEFPVAETVAGILAPAGLIKKGVKQLRKVRPKEEPKKRRGGLTALSR